MKKLLHSCVKILRKKKIPDFQPAAVAIFCHVLRLSKEKILLKEFEIDGRQKRLINAHVKKVADGYPLDYILGKVNFYNCELMVNKDVLIPRPETELLVDLIVQENDLNDKVIFDLCAGSGCIGIALAKAAGECKVVASDICRRALKVAKKNAKLNKVKISFLQGDLLAPFTDRGDIIICNPPYVAKKEYASLKYGLKHEPQKALIAKDRGLFFYKKLSNEIHRYLKNKGKIYLEIGKDQGEAIGKLFDQSYWVKRRVIKDYAGHERFFFLEKE